MPYRLLLAASLLLAACATTEDAATGEGGDAGPAPVRASSGVGPMRLVPDAPGVRTVQLYAGADERALPILGLGSGDALTLEFDLLTQDARPLSVYLQHADRTWRRDLLPIQFVQGFDRTDVLTYERSRLGATRYVHYRQAVPAAGQQLLVSGNYVAKVTELGDPSRVLFERPFFVAESGTSVQAGLYDGPAPLALGPAFLPLVRISTRGLDSAPFGYAACFVLGGRFEAPRCSERPYLVQPEALTFSLPAENAFRPSASTYFLDLRSFRTTPRIVRVDVRTDTTRVTLAPDDATFPDLNTPDLLGQSLVRDAPQTAGDPALTGEYAWVTFTFVPPGEVMLRDAYLEGSFSGWTRAVPLTWVPEARHYTGRLLLKQGRYEYRYSSSDPRLAAAQRGVLGRPEAALTSLVYFRDVRLNSDRLLAATTQRVRS